MDRGMRERTCLKCCYVAQSEPAARVEKLADQLAKRAPDYVLIGLIAGQNGSAAYSRPDGQARTMIHVVITPRLFVSSYINVCARTLLTIVSTSVNIVTIFALQTITILSCHFQFFLSNL